MPLLLQPRAINLAILADEELAKLLGRVTIAGGGVQPNIHQILLKKKVKSKKAVADGAADATPAKGVEPGAKAQPRGAGARVRARVSERAVERLGTPAKRPSERAARCIPQRPGTLTKAPLKRPMQLPASRRGRAGSPPESPL